MNRRILTLFVAVSTILTMSGCDAFDKAKENLTGDKKWVKEAQEKMPESITLDNAGKIYIAGEEYEFPMRTSDLLETGWEYSNRYDNLKGTTLKSGYELDEFEMYRTGDSNMYIQIKVYNDSNEEVSVDDTLVTHLEVRWQMCEEMMISGGIYIRQPEKDFKEIIETLGDDVEVNSKEGNDDTDVYSMNIVGADGHTCNLFIDVNTYGENEVFGIAYELEDTTENYGEIEDKGKYLNAFLENCFHDNDEYYVDTYGSKVDANELKDSYIENCADSIAYYCDIEYKNLSLIQKSDFDDLATKVLKDTKWNITVNDDTIDVDVTYSNFLDILGASFGSVYDEFEKIYPEDKINSMSDDEYAAVYDEYVDMLIKKIDENMDAMEFNNTVKLTYDIDKDTVISSDDIGNLTLVLLGFNDLLKEYEEADLSFETE